MKTELKVIEDDEEITIQLINGVVREIKLTREEYEDLQKIKLKTINEVDEFNDFWQMYPKRKAKSDAQKAWKKLKPSKDLIKIIFESLERFKKCGEWLRDGGQYIPYPASWLNGKRWEDEIIEERVNDKFDPAKRAIEELRQTRRNTESSSREIQEFIRSEVHEKHRY